MTTSTGKTDYATAPAEYWWLTERMWTKVIFLQAIEEHAPVVLEKLRTQVLPVYLPFHPDSPQAFQDHLIDYGLRYLIADRIKAEIKEWANEFNLCGKSKDDFQLLTWMTGTIIGSLMHWVAKPELPLKWRGLPERSIGAFLEEPDPFRFQMAGWALQSETEGAFAERALLELQQQLRNYIERRRKDAQRDLRLVRMPSRLPRDHFAYLVLFQCLRHSHRRIADHFGCNRNSVSGGIRNAAKAVIGVCYEGWLMPPLPAGRRKAKPTP
jgi:hypothetical protein